MSVWRSAGAGDDDAIVAMSLALYAEDPGTTRVVADGVRATLVAFREHPVRGRAVVLDVHGRIAGYAFLVSFWSNELGGEICTIDEIYVEPARRGKGDATSLVTSLRKGSVLWPGHVVALELEVTPANARARRLYERLGFRPKKNTTLRLLPARRTARAPRAPSAQR